MATANDARDEPSTATEVLDGGRTSHAVADVPVAGSRDHIGRTLGKFTVVERIGRGGSGEVFRAEQPELGRSAVIKVLRSDIEPSPHRVERFLREAQLASRLDHPYAAHVYGWGVETDGLMWLAMEHVRGTTLDELIARRGPMPPALFVPVFERLCEVVHSAHDLGIVHRDIKLANVMVLERAGQLLPKLLDFGIAKVVHDDKPDAATGSALSDPALTGHGAVVGSPAYMAPEQWSRSRDVDGRADVYALGILAYRCLSGRAPIGGASRVELAHAHVHHDPAPLGVGPDALDAAIRRALAKSRDDRWPTALDFSAAVRKSIGSLAAAETVPIVDAAVRDVWERGGPQPIADAMARLAAAATTVDADEALRDLIDVACRWLAAIALSGPIATSNALRDRARDVVEHGDAAAWLAVARAACDAGPALPELPEVLAGTAALAALAERRRRHTRSAIDLAADVEAVAGALAPLEPLLAYRLVVGGDGGAESWVGTRTRSRAPALVWDDAVSVGEVVLLDGTGRIALRLTPLVRAWRPLPNAEVELFVIARVGKGAARLAATPWGYERDDDEAGRKLAQLGTFDSASVDDTSDERSPYPGLAAYGVDDADRFFGREREIDSLANRLVRAPMVAVVGPSGVGKSSFVHAGVVARLQETYRVVTLRPGRHPTDALADALADTGDRDTVVIVDQLEELVTLCGDDDDRARFATELGARATSASGPIRVVATLRDDFASLLESIDGFTGRFEVFVLGPPSAEALRRIVVEPARRVGVAVESGVVDDVVAEVAGRAAALPLLGFTAARLWQLRDRERRLMTRTSYQDIGGVAGALATYADEVYASLGKREQAIARTLFGRLVAADGTRVPIPRGELATLDAAGVVDRLIDARLLVSRDPTGNAGDHDTVAETSTDDPGDDVIELVHECLAERWPRLARWRSEDAADRALLGDLRAATRRWIEHDRSADLLWRGSALADARRLIDHGAPITARERELLDASLAAARRSQRVRRTIAAAAMIVLAAVALVMAWLMRSADSSRDRAETSERTARSSAQLAETRLTQQLRATGQRELGDGRPIDALAYLAEVLRRGVDDDGIRLMIGQVAWSWPLERTTKGVGEVLDYTAAGDWIAATDDPRGKVIVFGGDGTQLRTIDIGWIQSVALDRDTDQLLMIGERAVEIAPRGDPDRRATLMKLPKQSEMFGGCFGPAADEVTLLEWNGKATVFGRDGKPRRRLTSPGIPLAPPMCFRGNLLSTGPNVVRVVDLVTMRPVFERTGKLIDARLIETGDVLVTGETSIEIVDAKTGRTRHSWTRPADLDAVEISDDGTRIAISGDRELQVHAADGKRLFRAGGFRGAIRAVAFDGDDVWTGGGDGLVRRWRGDGVPMATLLGAGGTIYELIKTPSGIAAFSRSGARFWSTEPTQIDAAPDAENCSPVMFAVARSRSVAAVVCNENEIQVWDFEDGTGGPLGDTRDQMLLAIHAEGRRFAVIAFRDKLQFWRRGTREREVAGLDRVMSMAWVGDKVWAMRWNDVPATRPDAPTFEAQLVEVDPETGAIRELAPPGNEAVVAIHEIGPGLGLLVVENGDLIVSRDGAVAARTATGLPQNDVMAAIVDVASSGNRVAIAGKTGAIAIYDLPALAEVRRIQTPGTVFSSVTLDRDGAIVVAVSSDRRATMWSAATGEPMFDLPIGDAPAFEAHFSSDPESIVLFVGDHLSRMRLPRAGGSAADLAAELGCRIPLRPEAGTLVAVEPTCK